MKPGDVFNREMAQDGPRFGNTLGCQELETAAMWLCCWLMQHGNEWTRPFSLAEIRRDFSGTDDQWSDMVCHYHGNMTSPCLLTAWLDNVSHTGRFVVSDDFVRVVTRGSQDMRDMGSYAAIANAARMKVYIAIARERGGLRLDDVLVTHNGSQFTANIAGEPVWFDDDAFQYMIESFEEAADDRPDHRDCYTVDLHLTASKWVPITLPAERVKNGEYASAKTKIELLAQLLVSVWKAKVC